MAKHGQHSGVLGNQTLAFAKVGRNVLSIEPIKPTGDLAIVTS